MAPAEQEEQKKHIKWVDFTVTKDAMYKAFRYDVGYPSEGAPFKLDPASGVSGRQNMVEIFLNTGHQTWRHWFQSCIGRPDHGRTGQRIWKYYSYYLEAYTAVLGYMVGEFEIQVPKEENSNEKDPEKKSG